MTELSDLEDTLARERAMFKLLIDQLPANIYLKDLQARKTLSNPADLEYIGRPLEEVLGKTDFDLFPPEVAARFFADDQYVLQTGKPVYNREEEATTTDGHKRWLLTSKLPLLDENGQVSGLMGIGRDITETKLAQLQLQQYSNDLEAEVQARTAELRLAQEKLLSQEKLAVLGQMAGSVGHELRTPLSIISNVVYLLKKIQQDADANIQEYLDIISLEVHTANRIIDDLLNFARPRTAVRQAINVASVLKQALTRFPPPAEISVSVDVADDLPPAWADELQVTQVAGNLILNAYQAMLAGGSLTIKARQEESFVCIAVEDTGLGILPEDMPRLFEPLFTTKSGGLGLGLVVSRKLVESNDGRIEVHSTPGQGSVFTIYLPVFPPHRARPDSAP